MSHIFSEEDVLEVLRHYLPSQLPLKDFIHHNTLHAFQKSNFFDATREAAIIFGANSTLSLRSYRKKYEDGEISDSVIETVISRIEGEALAVEWKLKMFEITEPKFLESRIGRLRAHWQSDYSIDMDGAVRPNIIRLVNAYLDQGIAFKPFPNSSKGLLDAVSYIQEHSYVKLFRSKRVIKLLKKSEKSLIELLELIVGDERFYTQYLLDQQYSHPGISGLVSAIESKPSSLNNFRPIALFDLVYLELLFELESLEKFVNVNFKPLAIGIECEPEDIFREVPTSDYWKVIELWQESLEFMYHDQVLAGLMVENQKRVVEITSQAFFCIDDREESIRRNIELINPNCQTFGTPAHFSIVTKFKPENAKLSTQICPAPFNPRHLIKEKDRCDKQRKDIHFQSDSHKFIQGFIISQTVGFWSSIKLLLNIFNPKESAAQYSATSDHMDYKSTLIYENIAGEVEDGLQVGYTVDEMIDIVFKELSNTGLVGGFAPMVYFFGHGGSSTNNPYFAGYNCGACSGRPSTLNARLFAILANRSDVRVGLKNKGIEIPHSTVFVGGYHDTTQDTFAYFDEATIPVEFQILHESNKKSFEKGLELNAKERARQFVPIKMNRTSGKVHQEIKKRARALFEPRPEYNHSNNCLFIIGERELTRNLFLDQRAFLNSYNYRADKDGMLLRNILNAGTGVCGGINLEYFFSTVDNEKLGAGSKLPQNIIGLYGVANGVKGDLRPGLPWQMIDVHEPVRILTIVENTPEIVLEAIESNQGTYEWYSNGWMKLAVIDPYTKKVSMFSKGKFEPYEPLAKIQKLEGGMELLFESSHKNLPVYQLS
jgi:uncharacterized protein YbcC (UPF0753/DUF2309 family)